MKEEIIIMDYKSVKHLNLTLIDNYNFDRTTLLLSYNRLFSLFTECGFVLRKNVSNST